MIFGFLDIKFDYKLVIIHKRQENKLYVVNYT